MVTAHTIDTLPPNNAAAAFQVARDLADAGKLGPEEVRSLTDGLIFSEEVKAFTVLMDAADLPVSP